MDNITSNVFSHTLRLAIL